MSLVAVVASAACTTVLGIDEDYTPLGDAGTGGTSATGSGTTPTGSGTTPTGTTATGSGGTAGAGGGTPTGNLLPQGSPCTDGAACDSSHCVDDVCCDTACDGECHACSAAKNDGTDGTCAPIPAYDDPDEECLTDYACDGNGTCKREDGVACTGGGNCISGNCDDENEECVR
jgi:hypothetical protein